MVHVHKDLIGAPEGKINIIFVDDVNLPARDAFDSQPPLELLRQLVSEITRGTMKSSTSRQHPSTLFLLVRVAERT